MKHTVYSLFLLVGFAFPIPALAANCPAEVRPVNSIPFSWPSTPPDTEVYLTCSEVWFDSGGDVSRYCDASGNWSAPSGSCYVDTCPSVSFSSGGVVLNFPYRVAGQSASVNCSAFNPNATGTVSRTCNSDGSGWAAPVGACEITPPDPDPNPDPNPNPNPSGSPVAQALDSLIQPLNLGAVQSVLLAVGLLILAIFATFVAIRIALKLLRMWG